MKCSTPLLLLPVLLGLTQCIGLNEAPVPALPMPAATQTGANIAGCVVDGERWVASSNVPGFGGGTGTTPATRAEWGKTSTGRHHLSLYFVKSVDEEAQALNRTNLKLEVPDITKPGSFVFDQAPRPEVVHGPIGYAAFTFNRPSPPQELLTGPATPGRLVVTRLDTVARIVSGTFEFTAAEVSNGLTGNGTPVPDGKTVRVTEGRFDCTF